MPNKIRAKIDLRKIQQQYLFNAKSGAQFLDITLIPSKDSRYGETHFIVQDVPKAEREKGIKGGIIGNATEWFPDETPTKSALAPKTNDNNGGSESIPF